MEGDCNLIGLLLFVCNLCLLIFFLLIDSFLHYPAVIECLTKPLDCGSPLDVMYFDFHKALDPKGSAQTLFVCSLLLWLTKIDGCIER